MRQAVLDEVERRGSTLVVVEHRIEDWLPHVDRLVVLGASGEVVADGAPADVLAVEGAALARAGVWVPGEPPPAPLLVDSSLVSPLAAYDGDLVMGRRSR